MKNNNSKFRNNYQLLTALLIFTAVAASRFWMLGHASFGTDAMEFYKMALHRQSILELWRNPPWLNQIPLNETLSLLMVKIGLPATPFVVRLPFAVMGALSVFFVWQFARRWFGANVALLILLLACFNPYALYHARTSYHYSGVICFSAILFYLFWSIKEQLLKKKNPGRKNWVLWFVTAALACHMHMCVWMVVAVQALLLFIFGLTAHPKKTTNRRRFFTLFFAGSVCLALVMSRWIYRGVQMMITNTVGGGHHTGADAKSEFLRLLPSYFAGENVWAIALLLVFIALAVFALFGTTDATRRFRSLAWICALHIAVLMLYVAVVGGGVAKITYFSAIWPHFILFLGVGSFLGVRSLASMPWRVSLYTLLVSGYLALTGLPVHAIIRLEGSPAPYFKINEWVLKNLPAGTPVLTDRWLEPWNELAVHNPGNINYAFTVPDGPLEIYRKFNWRKTAEAFFEKYPEASFLELERGKYEAELGKWDFPQTYFARKASVTNEPALALRRWKVFLVEYGVDTITNRVITHIYYNKPEDLVAAAQKNGRDVLRLYGAGWGYAKPGWQQGHFDDYRILGQNASVEVYNLKETPLRGTLEISAAPANKPKPVSVNGVTTVFASGRLRTWSVPVTLQVGKNTIPFSSSSSDPLFVLDIRWNPAQP